MLKFGEFINLISDLLLFDFSEPYGLEVLHVSSLEMFKFTLDQLDTLFFSKIFIAVSLKLDNILKRIAQVLSCFSLMVSVVSHAKPAKFIAALRAGHVHAATIFLDIRFAFGAWLGIKLDPLLISIKPEIGLIKPFLK